VPLAVTTDIWNIHTVYSGKHVFCSLAYLGGIISIDDLKYTIDFVGAKINGILKFLVWELGLMVISSRSSATI